MRRITWLLTAVVLTSCSAPGEHPMPNECPESCPVIAICKLCDDGSCADAVVSCNPDGSCGAVDWVCAEPEPEPEPGECAEPCPVPKICYLCDDESCAVPDVQCNEDGSCGAIDWVCE